jgi:hypothetical protein
LTEPPAFSTFSIAVREAPATSRVSFAFSSPSARIADTVLDAADHAGSLECGDINGRLAIKLACIDRSLDPANRHDVEVGREDVVEAALGQTTVNRHLAAFKAVDGDAGTGLLTLDAAATGLAGAGTDTAAYALAVLGSAFVVGDSLSFMINSLPLTSRRRRERGG